ncbi:MAG: AI-2E family transporter [Eubacterium sp.]|nr:AI-2E family transporter [Eubacterium sp.]
MKFNKNFFKGTWRDYALAACIAVLFYVLLTHLNIIYSGLKEIFRILIPILLGLVIAYVMNPLVGFFENRVLKNLRTAHIRRNLAILFAFIAVCAGIVLLFFALIPQLIDSVSMFIRNMGSYVNSFSDLMASLQEKLKDTKIDISPIMSFSDSLLSRITAWLTENSNNILQTSVSIGRNVFNWVIGIILAIYFLVDKERLLNGVKNFLRTALSETHYYNTAVFWRKCNSILLRYVIFDLLDGLIIGLANCVFMLIVGLQYPALISVVVGVTNLAPTFGPIVGAAIGAFILVLVNPWHALWFLIFTLILQTIDGYVLKPKLFGSSLGVSSVWILITIILGGRMFGVVGILLAIPFAAIIDYIYKNYILVKLREAKEKKQRAGDKPSDES